MTIRLPDPIEDQDPLESLARLAAPGASLVVDGGANKGRTAQRLLALFPEARLVAYEPLPRLAHKLAKRFATEPRVTVRQAALGSRPGALKLNEMESATCSSLLSPSAIREKHPDKPMGVANVLEVEVVRLDQELDAPPQAVKLDLQGYELEALKGLSGLLPGVKAVLCEVSFREHYVGQPLAGEIVEWMAREGFTVEGLYAPWMEPGSGLVAADALFVR